MVVRAAEHFLDEVRPFSCAAVPLFGPSGSLVGVLDATHGSAYARNAALADAAQKIADGVCKGTPMPTDASAVFRSAQGLDPMLRNRLAAPWIGYDLRQEDIADIAKDAAAYSHVGVGVCQGNVNGNPGAIAVLILFAGP